MKELITLALFIGALLVCILLNISILIPLLFGWVLFFLYGIGKKLPVKRLLKASWQGVCTVRTVLLAFLFIGMITAAWRASGTIAAIVYDASGLLMPRLFLLSVFLLNCLLSLLTGTAFGTAATMGVICMSMGLLTGMDPALLGGAILAGCFFGDRCSPISSSALLVATLTHTSVYDNIPRMLRNAVIPFALTCLIYLLLGFLFPAGQISSYLLGFFPAAFDLHWLTLLPAALIIILSLLRLNLKWILGISVLAASLLALFLQDMSLPELLQALAAGYTPKEYGLTALMGGGGIVSMIRPAAIICISSTYSGLFAETGLLNGLQNKEDRLAQSITPFGASMLTAAVCGMVACNQVLNIMLSHQICGKLYEQDRDAALMLEDTAVVMSPLIPWSIASTVPLTSVGAPVLSICFAYYLYLLPLTHWLAEIHRHKKMTP